MTSSDPAPVPARFGARALRIATTIVVVLLIGATFADRAFRDRLVEEHREDAAGTLGGYAAALERSSAEHEVLVEALADWMSRHPAATDADFQDIAGTLYGAGPSILALNLIRGSIIDAVHPVETNQAALGIDLETHTQPASWEGLLRARASGAVALAGPLPLAQGAVGVIFFRTGGEDAEGRPLAAEVVVEVDALVNAAGLGRLASDMELDVSTAAGTHVWGRSIDPALAPVVVDVEVPDGPWRLSAAPRDGWLAGRADRVWAFRLMLLSFVLLVGAAVYGLLAWDERVSRTVEHRTAELNAANRELESQRALREAAMAAGGVDVWAWYPQEDRLVRSGALQRITGSPDEESIASLLARVHPHDRALVEEKVEDARTSGTITMEYRERASDGSWIWARAEGRTSESRDGRPIRILGAAADITGVKRLESELLHHDRVELIGQLAGGVVHDINNALSVVIGELEMALEDVQGPPSAEEAINEAFTAGRYAAVLTGQLLSFARKDEVLPVVFEWDTMCESSTSFLSRVLGRGVDMRCTMGAEGARVRIDRTQAMQILANLATNARDAMNARGSIEVRTRRVANGAEVAPEATPGPAVVTEIRDTGPGIPVEVQSEIFDAFFTTKHDGHGTGLGLSITRRIARDAGGDVTFETSSSGTTFHVVLPIVD